MNLVHVADLRCVGGVERMLADFIVNTPYIQHHLVLQALPVHKSFQAILACVSSVTSSKYFFGFPVPKKIRVKNRARQINSLPVDRVLVWNQVIDLTGVEATCIYYEHGSAWYEHSADVIQKCFENIQHIIAVSYAAKRMLQLKHQVMLPITVEHNVLLSSLIKRNEAKRTLVNKGKIVLGSAGRLIPAKCLQLLVLTVYELQRKGFDVVAKIAGTGHKQEEDNIYSLIDKYQVRSRVELLGLVEDMEVFYESIDIYISTSMHESFGLTCLEAASHGLPVIAGCIDGLPEVVKHEKTGFCLEPTLSISEYQQITGSMGGFTQDVYFPSSDTVASPKVLSPDAITEKIIYLIENPLMYEEMSHQAFLHGQSGKQFSALCQNILNLCESS